MSRLNKINKKLIILYEEDLKQAKLFLKFNEVNIQSKEIEFILKKWIDETEKKLKCISLK